MRGSAASQKEATGLGRYMTRRMWWVIIGSAIVFLLLFAYLKVLPYLFLNVFMSKSDFIQPQAVSVAHAVNSAWQGQVKSVGTLHAVEGADLASEVAGIVTKIEFKPGDDVPAGKILIQLRDDTDRATLAALRATAEQYTVTYKRNQALAQANAISKQSYDQAVANWKSAVAQADAQAALVEKKAIRAPFAGRVGIRQVDVGQYVAAGTTMVTLQQLNPIDVDFSAAQQQVGILKPGDPVLVTTDAVPGKTFKGKIIALDPKIDPTTRTVRVRAEISNPDKTLIPGMFANVITDIGGSRQHLTLPQTAVTYNPYGDVVYVVTPSKNEKGKDILVANQRFVTTGETRGDQVAILSGITDKDLVVTAGQLKLKNGAVVFINNAVRMPNNPAPNPIQQ